MKNRAALALGALGLLLWAAVPLAHDVPSDVRILAYLKAEGPRLRLLVRAPMASMNDIPFPTNLAFLSLADPEMAIALRDGATDWIAGRIEVYEGDTRLTNPRLAAVHISLPSDTSFDSYDTATRALLGPPLPVTTELAKSQAMVDAMFEYPIRSDQSRFSINPQYRLLGLRTLTVLKFIDAGNVERTLQFHDDPGLVHLDPTWLQAARIFVAEGFFHILSGYDHLLFLFCLVIPFRRIRPLFWTVTSFVVAHSITLVAATYDMVPSAGWFSPLVQLLIAISILYMALENMTGPRLDRRWMFAFGFGLVHGLDFAFALRDTLQLAGARIFESLVAFNVGAELGQLLVLALLVPAIALLFRFVVAERAGTIVISAIVAHTAWHWSVTRGQLLWRYQFGWPDFTVAFFADATRWLIVIVAAAGAAWLMKVLANPSGVGARDSG